MDETYLKSILSDVIHCLGIGDQDRALILLTELMQADYSEQQDAEQLLKTKKEIFDMVSHRIRTPVSTIIGYAELLEDSALPSTQQQYLKELRIASDTLEHCVNDLLDLTRTSNEKLPEEVIIYHVRPFLEEIVHQHASLAEGKGIELHLLIHADIPEKLMGDPGRIRQMIHHFLHSALQNTSAGEIVLEASVIRGQHNQIELQVRITDTSSGMTPEQVQRLCAPLCMSTTLTQSASEGSPSCVATCMGLFDSLQGELLVRSMVGSGSTFHFSVVQKCTPFVVEEKIPSHDILRGKRVMLIGESKTQQEILRLYLTQAELVVIQADTPTTALRALNKQFEGHLTADVIILDSRLKNTNVVTFPELLKKLFVSNVPPVLLITAVANRGDSKTALDHGFSGYITKPIRQLELLDSLSLLFSKKTVTDEAPPILITRHHVSEIRHAHKDRVLLAEDNKMNQKLVQMMLHRLGIDCDVTRNSHETIEALEKHKYQMVFMTSQLSGLDSIASGNPIQLTPPGQGRVPIIAMLSSASSNERNAILAKGVNDVLTKPINMQSLQTMITRYMPIKQK